MSGITLWSICHDQYFRTRVKLRSEKTRIQYRLSLKNLSTTLGRDAVLDDLTDDNLAALCQWLLDQELSEYTINERVGRIKSLWNWLARRGAIDRFPTFERLETEEIIPRAWTAEELRRLFESCQRELGTIDGIPASSWWLALHSWLWCTSERKGATFAMTWAMIDLDGMTASLPGKIRKGRSPRVYDLWPDCCRLLRAIQLPRRELVFPWPFDEGTYYYRYGRLLRRAGLPDGRHNKTHAMRVTHATWREATGGNASQSLGHADPATTRKHYLDPRITRQSQPAMFWPGEAG